MQQRSRHQCLSIIGVEQPASDSSPVTNAGHMTPPTRQRILQFGCRLAPCPGHYINHTRQPIAASPGWPPGQVNQSPYDALTRYDLDTGAIHRVSALQELARVAEQAVRIGHDLLKSHRPGTVTEKTDRDLVTELDTRIEREVRVYLHDHTPDIGFVGGEEGAHGADSSDRWVLDPIDGTVNFVHGIPLCAVSLALVREDQPIIGVIGAPFLGMHYQAIEGEGAYGNGSRLQCSETTNLAHAIISIGDYATGLKRARRTPSIYA
jgi:hypothetical protein